jgi:hypothetical protein
MTVRHIPAILGLVVLVPGACFAQQPAKSQAQRDSSSEPEAYILQLTQEVLDAELRSDHAAMNRLFSDNYTHTHQSGAFQNKTEFIAEFAPGKQKYRVAEISEVQVRHFGTSAIVNGRENINDHHYLFLCVWVQGQGKWRMAAWVTSPAPKNEGAPGSTK